MIMMMMIVLIMICSRPPLYGYHADTSLSRTVFFVPGESPYDFLQIQPALCGHLLMWTTQWTLVSCQINRFSWNVNLANADSSFSPCAVINLSLFKIKKIFVWKYIDVPSTSVHQTGWIVDVNFGLFCIKRVIRGTILIKQSENERFFSVSLD